MGCVSDASQKVGLLKLNSFQPYSTSLDVAHVLVVLAGCLLKFGLLVAVLSLLCRSCSTRQHCGARVQMQTWPSSSRAMREMGPSHVSLPARKLLSALASTLSALGGTRPEHACC
jgi:hypothetical protein